MSKKNWIDEIINGSRISNENAGSMKNEMLEENEMGDQSENKWVFSFLIGFLFFILASPLIFISLKYMNRFDAITRNQKVKIQFVILLLQTFLFVMILRFILW